MMSTTQAFLSITGGKCWDGGWLALVGKVHGVSQVYIPLALNHGCSMIARQWLGRHVEVVVNDMYTFVSTLRVKKKSALVVPLPWHLRGVVNGVVTLKIRPIKGDGYGNGAGS
jgi:hypothetical protein